MTAIERNCKRLLLAYPRWYRQDRGDEIVGTLLEATGPDRSWPSRRDARALILSGLRARAGLDQRLDARAGLLQAVLLAAVLVLAYHSALALGYAALGFISAPWGYALGLATLTAIAGAWFGPPRVVAVIALATAGLWIYQPPFQHVGLAVEPVLALICVATLTLRRKRLPRPMLWLAVPWYLAYLWDLRVSSTLPALAPLIVLAVIVATIAWSAVDIRPLLALALATTTFAVGIIIAIPRFGAARLLGSWPYALIGAFALAIALVAIRRLRRQALL